MEEQVRAVMADILNLDPNAINTGTSRENTDSWDSLNHINLVVGLEQQFGVSFAVEEIESMMTFEDIVRTLEAKLPN